jgi:RNA polymerase sigma-70 factor, ECF subfamily
MGILRSDLSQMVPAILRHWPRLVASLRSGTGKPAEALPSPGTRSQAEPLVDFERFFRRYESRITGYLWRMTGDIEEASDLCQETFLRAWQHFPQLCQHPHPAAWLFRVATNLALNHARRRSPISLEMQSDPASSDPSGKIIQREIVRQTLQELPIKQRSILILRVVYEFSYADIGAALGTSPDAVKMALSRAREQFRFHYHRKDDES